jgi:hypothetical protein
MAASLQEESQARFMRYIESQFGLMIIMMLGSAPGFET